MKKRLQYPYLDVFNSKLVRGAYFSEPHQFPELRPTYFLPAKAIPFDKALQARNHQQWVHFYIDDYRFERVWKDPDRYLPILQRFDGVITPDFSLYSDMPRAMQIWNTYRNRAIAYWLQDNGVNIIPSINWGGKASYDFCFEGIAQGCNVAISSNGCLKNPKNREIYQDGIAVLMDTLSPRGIIHYSTAPESIWLPYKSQLKDMAVIENYQYTVRKKAV